MPDIEKVLSEINSGDNISFRYTQHGCDLGPEKIEAIFVGYEPKTQLLSYRRVDPKNLLNVGDVERANYTKEVTDLLKVDSVKLAC